MARKNKTTVNSDSITRLEVTDEVRVLYGKCPKDIASNDRSLFATVGVEATLTKNEVEVKSMDFSYDLPSLMIDNESENGGFYNISNTFSSVVTFEQPVSVEIMEHFANCMFDLAANLRKKHKNVSKIL